MTKTLKVLLAMFAIAANGSVGITEFDEEQVVQSEEAEQGYTADSTVVTPVAPVNTVAPSAEVKVHEAAKPAVKTVAKKAAPAAKPAAKPVAKKAATPKGK